MVFRELMSTHARYRIRFEQIDVCYDNVAQLRLIKTRRRYTPCRSIMNYELFVQRKGLALNMSEGGNPVLPSWILKSLIGSPIRNRAFRVPKFVVRSWRLVFDQHGACIGGAGT